MGECLRHLFSPINIGSMEVSNRIVFSAMHLGYATPEGFVTDRLRDFYRERAKGGAGLIVLGMAYIDWVGTGGVGATNVIGIDDDKFVPGLKELVEVVHGYGAKFAAQLYHAGWYSLKAITGLQPVSASSVPTRLNPDRPRELSTTEVVETIEKYGEAARRAREAGFDAVELTGTAGYLINQFLSPITNRRQDRYGGSFRNRLGFILEIIECIKGRVGKDFPLIYRTCGCDYMEGGLTQDDYKTIAQETEGAGVHAIGVNGGWHEARIPEITMQVPRAAYIYLAEGLKEVVNIPVIAANRINDPLLAEELIQQKRTDLIGMCRPLLADPELPNKAKEGRLEDIRMCIACNQGCLDNLFLRKPIECLVNARAGKEKECEIKPAQTKKRVAVIGGGPAGMEAARVASLRGHQVTLYEKSDSLGGQLSLASLPPGKDEIENIVKYLKTQIAKLGVDIKLEIEANADVVREGRFDAVVVAIGGAPIIPEIAGINGPNVAKAEDVLKGKVEVAGKVIIMGGGSVGCDVALFLANKRAMKDDTAFFFMKYGVDCEAALSWQRKAGNGITIVEKLPGIGKDIGPTTRWIVLDQIEKYGVEVVTSADVKEIREDGIVIEKEGELSHLPADTIILSVGYKPNTDLVDQLKECPGMSGVYTIGDCIQPRKAIDAIQEGFRIGHMI
ncbi:FAD-dependent oxidoreductase [Chloroflexota bacterium]